MEVIHKGQRWTLSSLMERDNSSPEAFPLTRDDLLIHLDSEFGKVLLP